MSLEVLHARDWTVGPVDHGEARALVAAHHYAKGASNTYCYLHGLYSTTGELHGVAWWLPPTRVAAESVNRGKWTQVLSLSRLVLRPDTPKNAATFLLGRSVRLIAKDGRFVSLVTYADTEQGHTGHIYRAAGWNYVGLSKPSPVWIDNEGKRVAAKSTVNRSKAQMEALGHRLLGYYAKHKFVKHLPPQRVQRKWTWG